MAPSFENKIILMTGSASGIGRATAIKLSSLGGTCALQDINASSLAETQSLCSVSSKQEHMISAFDVSSTDSVNAFVAEVIKKYGHIDHVFNCAGINPTSIPTETMTDEYWDRTMNVNLKGMFNITRAAIPHLQEGSSFVNVASISGLTGTAGHAVYCASKFGVIGFSKCMALELGPKDIRVNIVAPGYIDTPTNASVVAGKASMERSARAVSMGRMGTAEEVADVVAFLFGEEARYMNGSVVEITGGISK